MQITKDESTRVLKIAGTLAIGDAEELLTALRNCVEGDAAPTVDLSGVDGCDTAALQLLCSARKTAERMGKHLELAGISAAMGKASEALGLAMTEVADAI